MIDSKEKPCKGTGDAKGRGCGVLTKHRVYGLGKMCGCYSSWLLNTEKGKQKLEKSIQLGKNKFQKEKQKKEFADKAIQKVAVLSPDKYRAKHLQPIINEISRLIDFGQSCIASGNFGKMNGGHYISVGANRTTALNLHNIHIQSFESNHHKSGDQINYRLGLIERYGKKYFEFIETLQRHRPLHLSTPEMIEIASKASRIRLELRRNEEQKTPYERIELRNKINIELGIYDRNFCEYKH